MEIVTRHEKELAELAGKINAEHLACAQSLSAGMEHALNAGRLLLEAKTLCAHGEWSDWISQHCDFSERTAQNYMRVVRKWKDLQPKAQPVADLSLREALRLLQPPAPPSGELSPELEKVQRFAADFYACLEEARESLAVCRLALETADSPDQLLKLISVAHRWQNRMAEWNIRIQREAGRFLAELEERGITLDDLKVLAGLSDEELGQLAGLR